MEIDIQIRNLTRRQVNGARIKKAIAAAVNGEKKRFAGEGAEISVVLVGKKRMAAINQKLPRGALGYGGPSFREL